MACWSDGWLAAKLTLVVGVIPLLLLLLLLEDRCASYEPLGAAMCRATTNLPVQPRDVDDESSFSDDDNEGIRTEIEDAVLRMDAADPVDIDDDDEYSDEASADSDPFSTSVDTSHPMQADEPAGRNGSARRHALR